MAALIRPAHRAARRAAVALALGLAALVGGCVNPFEPAEPQAPDANSFVADYSTPGKLLRTLEAAMANKGPAGANAWAEAMAPAGGVFGSGFVATLDPLVEDKWRISSPVPPPEPWDLDLERVFFSNFVAAVYPAYEFEVIFEVDEVHSIDEVIDDAAGTAQLHQRYYVAALLPGDNARIVAIGIADLSLVKDGGRWYILQWNDRVDPGIGVNPSDQDNVTMGWRRLESR